MTDQPATAGVAVRWTCPRPSCGREHSWTWEPDDVPAEGLTMRMHCEACPAVTPMFAHRVDGGVRMVTKDPAGGIPQSLRFAIQASDCDNPGGVLAAVSERWLEIRADVAREVVPSRLAELHRLQGDAASLCDFINTCLREAGADAHRMHRTDLAAAKQAVAALVDAERLKAKRLAEGG